VCHGNQAVPWVVLARIYPAERTATLAGAACTFSQNLRASLLRDRYCAELGTQSKPKQNKELKERVVAEVGSLAFGMSVAQAQLATVLNQSLKGGVS